MSAPAFSVRHHAGFKIGTDFNFHNDFIQKFIYIFLHAHTETVYGFSWWTLNHIKTALHAQIFSAKPSNLILFSNFCAVERPRCSEHKCFLQLVLLVYKRWNSDSTGWDCLSPTGSARWIFHWLPCGHLMSTGWNDCFPVW